MTGRRRRYLTEWQAVGLAAAAFVLTACASGALIVDRLI